MKCNAPTVAYRLRGINPKTGNHYPPVSFRQFSKIFDGSEPLDYRVKVISDYYHACPPQFEAVLLPCKKCLLCLKSYRRMWSFRIMAEASTCSESMFLTLTVDDEHLQQVFPNGSLRHKPFQDFFKRLRITFERGYDYAYVPPFTPVQSLVHLPRNLELRHYQRKAIKYYMCGEYGDLSMRPHYHVCVLGARFPDAYFAKKVNGEAYYMSPTLNKLWPFGKMSLFSDVTSRSAGYVAGYVDKKLLKSADDFRKLGLEPEYVRMSQGIGLDYFNRHKSDLYRFTSDGDYFGEFFEVGNVPISAPRYFDEKLRLRSPAEFDTIVAARECRRLARLAHMSVSEQINESGRKHLVAAERKRCRVSRDLS